MTLTKAKSTTQRRIERVNDLTRKSKAVHSEIIRLQTESQRTWRQAQDQRRREAHARSILDSKRPVQEDADTDEAEEIPAAARAAELEAKATEIDAQLAARKNELSALQEQITESSGKIVSEEITSLQTETSERRSEIRRLEAEARQLRQEAQHQTARAKYARVRMELGEGVTPEDVDAASDQAADLEAQAREIEAAIPAKREALSILEGRLRQAQDRVNDAQIETLQAELRERIQESLGIAAELVANQREILELEKGLRALGAQPAVKDAYWFVPGLRGPFHAFCHKLMMQGFTCEVPFNNHDEIRNGLRGMGSGNFGEFRQMYRWSGKWPELPEAKQE